MMRKTSPTATSAFASDSLEEPLILPSAPDPPRRGAVPLLASVVPVLGAVALWVSTGSTAMLWFAALGPLIAAATLLDSARVGRRERRRAAADAAEARLRIAAAVDRRQCAERDELWARHPDVAGLLTVGQDGHDAVWRSARGRADLLVVGRGDVASTVRVSGGWAEADLEVKRHAATLSEAPVTIPAKGGIAVVGPEVCAAAVVRALTLQLVLASPPGDLCVIGSSIDDAAWTKALPHRATRTGTTLAVCSPGEVPPDADMVIARVAPGSPPPPACAAVLTLTAIDRGVLVHEGTTSAVEVEAVGDEQATELAAFAASRATTVFGGSVDNGPHHLEDVLTQAPDPRRGGLPAVIGLEAGSGCIIDLVADGPHAVVTGMTGAGKSELLTTWVTSLCSTHSAADVVFLLADFKGGTAFDALAGVPHVTGVITDLDGGGARRALESLRAELRRREAELVRVGARDVAEPHVRLPRLVIVVDEFAALAEAHPEMTVLFTDIAARGRALGMHLILGTQRATGVVRDALMANCALRISLRVADPGDSRAVIGTDDAAHLSGEPESRGVAFVRRASDSRPRRMRIALTSRSTVAAATGRASGPLPRRPWLPELPSRVTLAELSERASRRRAAGEILLGLADEPEMQRQGVVTVRPRDRGLAIVGRVGSGRTSLLCTIAAQIPDHTLVGSDLEAAWDALCELAASTPEAGHALLVDDLDVLLTGLPAEYAQATVEGLEGLVREAGDGGRSVFLAAHRLSGGVARLIDLLPRRAVLATASRADHVAAGGEPAGYRDRPPAGRGSLDGHPVQFALPPAASLPSRRDTAPRWVPASGVTGVVIRSGAVERRFAEVARNAGAILRGIEDAPALLEGAEEGTSGRANVVVGDAESWLRAWRTLSVIRSEHALLIDADCAGDYRMLTGDRGLPPYCMPGRRRAWLLAADGSVRRVRME